MKHLNLAQIEAGLDHVRESPTDVGTVELIVRRPDVDGREVLEEGELDPEEGLVGDRWALRAHGGQARSPNPAAQLTLMNARLIALLAQQQERWALAGDQLYVDLDLSQDNLPPGTQLGVGSAVVEVSPMPHTGCAKFSRRFGEDALRFVSTDLGKQLRLRGMYATVLQPGSVRRGDVIKKL